MFSTNAQQEFRQAVGKFIACKQEEYGSYAYPAGYLESMVVEMFGSLTKRQQKFFMEQVQKAVDKAAV